MKTLTDETNYHVKRDNNKKFIESIRTNKLDNCSKGESSLEIEKNLNYQKWLYTRTEVAKIFSISLVTLWNWKKRKVLMPIPNIGGRVYYSRTSITNLINQNLDHETK